jgi:glycoside/pentoside/hexuronide:cation symporter, GPH family
MNSQKLSVKEKIGYGLGDTAANLVWRTLMVFLPIFYTDVFGLSAAAVGTLLLICRYWDGITDYIMGLIADRTHTRWGKFRPWVLWTSVPFGILTVLTFSTPNLSSPAKLLYAYATYSGLIVVFTANNIPYSAMTGVLSSDPGERTSLSSYRFFFAFLGGLITQGLNIYLVSWFGQGDDIKGYRITMTLFALLSVLLFWITFFTTRERVQPPAQQHSSIRQDTRDLFRNRAWVVLFFMGLFFVVFATLKQGVTLYYFKYYVGRMDLAAAFMISGLLAAMAGAAATQPLTRRWGKITVMNVSLCIGMASSGLLYLVARTDHLYLFVLSTITECSTGPMFALFFAMLADAADYSEWKTGRRATALVFSAGALSMKFGTGIAGAMTGWLLNAYGYIAHAQQSEAALHGIRMLISIYPALACLIIIVVFQFYILKEPFLQKIHRELATKQS